MFFLTLTAMLFVPVAASDFLRGVHPLDRLGKHVGTGSLARKAGDDA